MCLPLQVLWRIYLPKSCDLLLENSWFCFLIFKNVWICNKTPLVVHSRVRFWYESIWMWGFSYLSKVNFTTNDSQELRYAQQAASKETMKSTTCLGLLQCFTLKKCERLLRSVNEEFQKDYIFPKELYMIVVIVNGLPHSCLSLPTFVLLIFYPFLPGRTLPKCNDDNAFCRHPTFNWLLFSF